MTFRPNPTLNPSLLGLKAKDRFRLGWKSNKNDAMMLVRPDKQGGHVDAGIRPATMC